MVGRKLSKSKLRRAEQRHKAALKEAAIVDSISDNEEFTDDEEENQAPQNGSLVLDEAEVSDEEEVSDDEEEDLDESEDESEDEEEEEEEEEESDDEELESEEETEQVQPKKYKNKRDPNRAMYRDDAAMEKLIEKIRLKDLPFIETMTVTSSKPTLVEDPEDDMKRELAFYQQALEAAHIGRAKIIEAGVPFSRPDDYFAEMVKSDEHMAKVRQRLLNQNARIKASEDAKRQRDLKKFGKKVQVQRQLERQKEKSETLDKIKQLKRKRKEGGADLTLDDDFDVALDANKAKKAKKEEKKQPQKSKKREAKDARYGMGGKKRNKKTNTAESSAALGNYNKMKGKPIYLGKGKKTGAKRK
ncbi:eukaryotic rRNA processing protein EBP2-domain-containing protein [Syncephalastrum racemosum]|uniref:Eukaryotic rRNA processing protein EBP2-domain-containing protein n=1 Tax=Syncephalastrum racemosum TaxID=13706 RepID=A0A1X2HGW3_SYNRA|nr:eukaryotic rRNA processing protein EBP2-domain-containing protein [Syncephalastrum racemosum]